MIYSVQVTCITHEYITVEVDAASEEEAESFAISEAQNSERDAFQLGDCQWIPEVLKEKT